MIVFGTGHREGVTKYSFGDMVTLAYEGLENLDAEVVITGMANGFDLAIAEAAMTLKLPLWTVRPWAGHGPVKGDEYLYEGAERYAERHVITNDSLSYPGPWVYQVRNEWMVDNGNHGLAFYNGKQSGGTYNCIKYAEKVGVPVTNIYP